MATRTAGPARPPGAPASNGTAPAPAPARTGATSWFTPVTRRRKGSAVVAGVACLLMAAVLGALLLGSSRGATVLALSRDLPAGRPLAAADLRTAKVADSGLATVPVADARSVVGRSAPVALPAGTVLNRQQFSAGPTLAPGQAVVGVVLEGAQLPTAELATGDRVKVVQTAGAAAGPAAEVGVVIVERAEVTEVARSEEGVVTVSLLVADAEAPVVAGPAATGRVSLALVPKP